jgi:hypothetical protein
MSQIILKNLPTTFIDRKIDFSLNILDWIDKNILVDTIEYLQDYLYINERVNEKTEYVEESDVLNLISKYK